jgi:triacylglycerol lipase
MLTRGGASRGAGWITPATVALSVAVQELVARAYYRVTPGPSRAFHEEEKTAWTAAWRELWLPVEHLALHRSATYRGEGVPRGDGAPVILVHGFLMTGGYLATLRGWLERIGYRARVAAIGWNADCFAVHTDRLIAAVRDARAEDDRAVHVIGHSLGGVLARAAAGREPELVASVATLASPFRGLAMHPMLRLANKAVRAGIQTRRGPGVEPECHTFACPCPTVRALAASLPADLPQLAIVTRADGMADWRYCIDPPTTRVVEVAASHFGLVFNATVYERLARHLAAATVPARQAG